MRKATEIKYHRVQAFYMELRRYQFTHSLCEQLIMDFFHLGDSSTISKIINTALTVEDYPFEDLDKQWIKSYVDKHIKKQQKKLEQHENA